MQMKKANYVVEVSKSSNAYYTEYQIYLPRMHTEIRMEFNDWLHFFDMTFHKVNANSAFDFVLSNTFTGINGYLTLYQSITAIIETSKPHALHVYAKGITESWLLTLIQRYQPQYGDKVVRKH
jgi:hypothetical protein